MNCFRMERQLLGELRLPTRWAGAQKHPRGDRAASRRARSLMPSRRGTPLPGRTPRARDSPRDSAAIDDWPSLGDALDACDYALDLRQSTTRVSPSAVGPSRRSNRAPFVEHAIALRQAVTRRCRRASRAAPRGGRRVVDLVMVLVRLVSPLRILTCPPARLLRDLLDSAREGPVLLDCA